MCQDVPWEKSQCVPRWRIGCVSLGPVETASVCVFVLAEAALEVLCPANVRFIGSKTVVGLCLMPRQPPGGRGDVACALPLSPRLDGVVKK